MAHLRRRLHWLVPVAASFAVLLVTGVAAASIDSALVGTWKLDGVTGTTYWAVRADGVYRLHGPSVSAPQVGRIEAAAGRWSIASPIWKDQGTYAVPSPGRWSVTGQLGTGTWVRVWKPGDAGTSTGAGPCALVTPAEVALALSASANGQIDPRVRDGGCLFRSTLSPIDTLSIALRADAGGFFRNHRIGIGAKAIDVPIPGTSAYAELLASGELQMSLLKNAKWVTIGLHVRPGATVDDVPPLASLARAIAGRL